MNPLLVKVSRKSKTKELIETAVSILTDKGQVVILGCEETITKAITVAEIIKRLQPLEQKTQIYRKEFNYMCNDNEVKEKKSCIEIILSNATQPDMIL